MFRYEMNQQTTTNSYCAYESIFDFGNRGAGPNYCRNCLFCEPAMFQTLKRLVAQCGSYDMGAGIATEMSGKSIYIQSFFFSSRN